MGSWLDLFRRSPEARLVMERARDAGIPYSEARERWGREDIMAEFGFEALLADERATRCQNCGSDPKWFYDEDGMPLYTPALMPKTVHCEACADVERMRDQHAKQDEKSPYRAYGRSVRMVPFVESEAPDPLRDLAL